MFNTVLIYVSTNSVSFPDRTSGPNTLISSLDVAPTLFPKGGSLFIQLQANTAQKDVNLDFQSKEGVFPIINAFQNKVSHFEDNILVQVLF